MQRRTTHTDNFGVAAHTTAANTPNTGSFARVTTATHTMTGGVTSSGAGTTGGASGSAFDVMNPWYALWFIIRAA